MKILVACEFSGIVRDAFLALSHDAWSCDILPTEKPGPHIQGDVLAVLGLGWDLMIAHPPCTYLSTVGNRHLKRDPSRYQKRQSALEFCLALMNAPIPRIAMENPQGHLNTAYRPPDQIIHPYYFGQPELKRTCLWLKNLPKLYWEREDTLFHKQTATERPRPLYVNKSGKNIYWTDGMGGKNKSHLRSKTFSSIAQAMAEQWGGVDSEKSEIKCQTTTSQN